MLDNDHWTELLQCLRCGRTGVADLSKGESPFEDHADLIPTGFKVVQTRNGGINFHCTDCDAPVKP
jgi:hypothetical protein